MALQPQATRSLRRVKVRTPGNRLNTHYIKRKPAISKCANCRKELKGIPRERPSDFRNLTLSQKTVSRPFGGFLCSPCSRDAVISASKESIRELPLEIGQVCIKTSGREGGNVCVIVDKTKESFVLIDGNVKRRKCNILHLATVDKQVKIKKNEDSSVVKNELKKLGYEIKDKKIKEKVTQKTETEKEEFKKKPVKEKTEKAPKAKTKKSVKK